MSTTVFAGLLVPVGKFIAKKVFGDGTLGTEITGGAIDLAKERFGDFRKARDASRKVEDLALSIVDDLADLARHERLDPEFMEQVARDILAAADSISLGDEIAKAGRDPRKLAPVIARALPAGSDPKDGATGLLVTAFADGLCRIAGELPTYERGKDQELFARLDGLLNAQAQVGRDVALTRRQMEALRADWQAETSQRRRVEDQNERQYREALHNYASQVKLLGLEGDRYEVGRALPLETAYVPLRLRPRSPDGARDGQRDSVPDISWPEILALLPVFGNRLLIEGIGGSGKTTLLQWTAVEALDLDGRRGDGRGLRLPSPDRLRQLRERLSLAEGRFTALGGPRIGNAAHQADLPGVPWYERVPLLVRLRHHADGKLPSPQQLPRLIADTALGTPEGWVRRVIEERRAIFLIDGIDEVREEGRHALADRIEAYLRDYEGCPVIATSRPAAVQDAHWASLFGPCRLLVERMAKPEIAAFVQHWYRAYGLVRGEPRDERATSRLLGQIEAREALVGLMDTPLLAASICFLNKDRPDELPTRAPELYKQLCRQLVHQLDEDRLQKAGYEALVPALKDLDPDNKLYLLAEIAQLMVNNKAVVLNQDQAVWRLQRALRAIGREQGREAEDVLHALQERSGLLRGSSSDTVEFTHNNLRAWLAARAFAEEDEHVQPVERAFDLRDADLPMLAAAQSTSKGYRARLIEACLRYAGEHGDLARTATIMALRCGQAGPVDSGCRARLDQLADGILPPHDGEEAAWLAELGEAIVGRLVWEPGRDVGIDAACVRCLRLIGGEAAKQALSSYRHHEAEEVLEELAQALPPLSIPRVKDFVIGRWTKDIYWEDYGPIRYISTSDFEDAGNEIRKSETLQLSGSAVTEVVVLANFSNLRSLDLMGTQVADLEPLRGLTALQHLDLRGTQVADLEPLRGLTNLVYLTPVRDRGAAP